MATRTGVAMKHNGAIAGGMTGLPVLACRVAGRRAGISGQRVYPYMLVAISPVPREEEEQNNRVHLHRVVHPYVASGSVGQRRHLTWTISAACIPRGLIKKLASTWREFGGS